MKLGLKLRLTLLFLVLSLTAWFAASLVAWQQTTHKLDKLFDTQQMLFAKRLLTMELDELHAPARMREVPKKAKHGHLDEDALAFAIYASDGTMILNDGENGRDIPYHYRRDGFDDGRLQDDNDEWRFLWLTSPDGKYRVVVGQEWEYRQDMAQTLRARSPDATDALPIQGVPAEVRPLLDSLNHLFARTQEMMTRERRFTSDAAHELRSPLAALKVQTDVAQLSQDDPQAQEKALTQLHAGIDRASRLVDQLLTLSRLDSLDSLDGVEQIAMADLLQSAVMDIYPPAQQAGIDIRLNINAPEVTRTGQQLLLSLLVRNLLDNATRYSPRGSVVDVTLDARRFTVRDNGPGISLDALTRLGERFYRPPGQDATGSGLGLSIVKRIAALHGMHVALGNAPEGGFEVNVSW